MRQPLHLVLGDNAGRSLRQACRLHGMPGTVVVVPDDLSHGPLDDGRSRIEYFRSCYEGYDEWRFDLTDAFAPWRGWLARLARERSRPVVIWSGPNASEAILLAMACWWLRDHSQPVRRVTLPTDSRCHVASCAPADLVRLFRHRRVLTGVERAALVADFERVRDDPQPRRCWEDNRLTTAPVDCFDHVLLGVCVAAWQAAARVVGAAMARTNTCHSVSDLFYCTRLQALIRDGRVEADGPRHRLGEYSVRLVDAR